MSYPIIDNCQDGRKDKLVIFEPLPHLTENPFLASFSNLLFFKELKAEVK